MRYSFMVTIDVTHVRGVFASRDELAESLRAEDKDHPDELLTDQGDRR